LGSSLGSNKAGLAPELVVFSADLSEADFSDDDLDGVEATPWVVDSGDEDDEDEDDEADFPAP
jgi:hypothetical protein